MKSPGLVKRGILTMRELDEEALEAASRSGNRLLIDADVGFVPSIETYRVIIRAYLDALPARTEASAAVKAITFTDPGFGILYADTIVGTYSVAADGTWWINNDPPRGKDGKAGVIAHYESRILSAFEQTEPLGPQESVTVT